MRPSRCGRPAWQGQPNSIYVRLQRRVAVFDKSERPPALAHSGMGIPALGGNFRRDQLVSRSCQKSAAPGVTASQARLCEHPIVIFRAAITRGAPPARAARVKTSDEPELASALPGIQPRHEPGSLVCVFIQRSLARPALSRAVLDPQNHRKRLAPPIEQGNRNAALRQQGQTRTIERDIADDNGATHQPRRDPLSCAIGLLDPKRRSVTLDPQPLVLR